jgi:peroxiredoxin
MTVLRDRRPEFEAAGVKTFGISRDSAWSHVAWAQALDLDGIGLLSDWNGAAVRAFGVAVELGGMSDVAARTAFLIEDGTTVRQAWMLGRELPDVDAIIAAAKA